MPGNEQLSLLMNQAIQQAYKSLSQLQLLNCCYPGPGQY